MTNLHRLLPADFGLRKREKPEVHSLVCQIRENPQPKEHLIHDAQFCSQKLYEFALVRDGKATLLHTLMLCNRNGDPVSTLRSCPGRPEVKFSGLAGLEQVIPYIQTYLEELHERRLKIGK